MSRQAVMETDIDRQTLVHNRLWREVNKMAKWYAYGPMGLFAYQVLLAFNGRDPLSIYSFVPTHIVANFTHIVTAAMI